MEGIVKKGKVVVSMFERSATVSELAGEAILLKTAQLEYAVVEKAEPSGAEYVSKKSGKSVSCLSKKNVLVHQRSVESINKISQGRAS